MRLPVAAWLFGLATLLLATGCGSGGGAVTIFAASSLTDAFKEAGAVYGDSHPGARLEFTFGSSQALAVQVNEGAPADVFASASDVQMDAVYSAGNVVAPRVFATNLLTVAATGESNVDSLDDLARPGLRLVIAAEDVPAGRYAREMLGKAEATAGSGFAARVLANVRSEEPSVRAVLTKVQLGEADAGIVYVSDLVSLSAEKKAVLQVDIPAEVNVVARYPVATVTGSKHAAAAQGFIDFLFSAEGQAILRQYGFGSPE